MNTQEKIVRSKIGLILDQPFFGQLVSYLEFIECEEVPTAGIDASGTVIYNKKFIDELSYENLEVILAHEVMHYVLMHPLRLGNRERYLWNVVVDLKVNRILRDNSFELPEGALMTIGYKDSFRIGDVTVEEIAEKSAEQVYDEFVKKGVKLQESMGFMGNDVRQGKNKGKGKGSQGESNQGKSGQAQASYEGIMTTEEKDKIKNRVEKILSNMKVQGLIPDNLKSKLDKLRNPVIHWTDYLRERLSTKKRRSTWRKFNKKFLPSFYFPGKERRKGLECIIAIDTSGSMSRKELSDAMSEVIGIAQSYPAFKMTVLMVDAKVQKAVEVIPSNYDELKKLDMEGGGGTSFRPAFKWVEDNCQKDPDTFVYFSDLYGDFPPDPGYKVFWVTESDDKDVPFGTLLKLK